MNKPKEGISDEGSEEVLCDKCGSVKVLEDDKYICPNCDVRIDYFGDDNEDDN